MKYIHIRYPYCQSKRLPSRDDIFATMGEHAADSETFELQTSDYQDKVAENLIILEPPIVHPHAYTVEYRRQFRKVYAFAGPDTGNVTPYRYRLPPLWPELPESASPVPWEGRKNAVIAICSNKYVSRYQELVELGAYCSAKGLGFDVFGRVPFDMPWYRGPADDKLKTLEQYKYCFCAENQELPLYCSEKLPEALAAGCIPIYGGAETGAYVWMQGAGIVWKWKSMLGIPTKAPFYHLMDRREWEENGGYRYMRQDMRFSHVLTLIAQTS